MTSRLQNDVSETMNRMDVPHVVEGMTEDGCFSIDIMLSQARIAVEVDGIHHFACNSRRPMGMALLAFCMPSCCGGVDNVAAPPSVRSPMCTSCTSTSEAVSIRQTKSSTPQAAHQATCSRTASC